MGTPHSSKTKTQDEMTAILANHPVIMALQEEIAQNKRQREVERAEREAETAEREREKEELEQLRRENDMLRQKARRLDEAGRREPTREENRAGKDTQRRDRDVSNNQDAQSERSEFDPSRQTSYRAETHTATTLRTAETVRRHPFVDGIVETPLPRGWKGISIDKYDGTTDPDEHVDAYTTQVNLYTNDDAILCKVFPSSLKGAALNWYTRLPPNSVGSFDDLVARFISQYATSRPHHLTHMALTNVRQDEGESLRVFMTRFSKICVQIRDLNPQVALHSITMALKTGPFSDSLCLHPPATMDELRDRASWYMLMEERAESREKARGVPPTKKPDDRNKGKEQREERKDGRTREVPAARFHNYAPLITQRSRILEEACNAELLSLPPERKSEKESTNQKVVDTIGISDTQPKIA